MPCIRLHDGFICVSGPVYLFEEFKFEIHSYFGPIRLNKKTGDPLKSQSDVFDSQSDAFFEAVERWQALPQKEREKYLVERSE